MSNSAMGIDHARIYVCSSTFTALRRRLNLIIIDEIAETEAEAFKALMLWGQSAQHWGACTAPGPSRPDAPEGDGERGGALAP